MQLDDEELENVVGGSQHPFFLQKWKKYLMEKGPGPFTLPSGIPGSECPQGAQQLGYLEKVGSDGRPLPRCVRDGQTLNNTWEIEEDFQQDVKKKHSGMKIRLIGKGGNKKKAAPYDRNPSSDRSKSSPPGFGGS